MFLYPMIIILFEDMQEISLSFDDLCAYKDKSTSQMSHIGPKLVPYSETWEILQGVRQITRSGNPFIPNASLRLMYVNTVCLPTLFVSAGRRREGDRGGSIGKDGVRQCSRGSYARRR